MRAGLLLLAAACCRGAHPTPVVPPGPDAGDNAMPRTPLTVSRASGEVPSAIVAPSWQPRGLGAAVFATTSADGGVVAVQLNVPPPISVLVLRNTGGQVTAAAASGNVLPGAPAMIGDAADDATEVTIQELARGTSYRAPLRVTSADAGGAPPDFDGACCGWWERTWWRASHSSPDAGLLRVADGGDWALADWYLPGNAQPRWRHPLDGRVVDAQVMPAANSAIIYTHDRRGGALTGYDAGTGAQRWQVPVHDSMPDGALVVLDADRIGVVVADAGRCETCAALEVRQASDGALVRRIALAVPFPTLANLGERVHLGVADGELWVRSSTKRSVGSACRLDIYDLADGAHREAEAPWADLFADCTDLAQVAPTAGGMIAIHPTDRLRFDYVRFSRAP